MSGRSPMVVHIDETRRIRIKRLRERARRYEDARRPIRQPSWGKRSARRRRQADTRDLVETVAVIAALGAFVCVLSRLPR